MNTAHAATAGGPTAHPATGAGAVAHVGNSPVYVAPAAHYLPIAPAAHVLPPEAASGIGISVDAVV